MAGGTDRDELADILRETREEAEDLKKLFARRGIEVTGVELDFSVQPFPDLLVMLVDEHVPGERVLRESLDNGGRLAGSTDLARGVMLMILECPWPHFADLPHAQSSRPGSGFGPGELAGIVIAVREELARNEEALRARGGVEVTGVELDETAGTVPDLLIFLVDARTPDERVLRQSLDWGGRLPGPSEAAAGFAHLVLEWPVIGHLPLAAALEREGSG